MRHHRAAVDARTRAHIDDVIRRADGILIMLYNDHGVAQIAQPSQRFEQAVIILLVQPDAGFIQHIEHARKPGTNLAGQPDTLAFAAAQRARCAIQIEIVQPHIVEEAKPFVDFLEDRLGNLRLLAGQLSLKRREPAEGIDHRTPGGNADILTRDFHRTCFGFQPRAAAHFAVGRGLIFGKLLAHPRAFGLQQALVEIADHARECLVHVIGFTPILKRQPDHFAARAV